MSTELDYSISYKPEEEEYYKLLGSNGESFYFYNKSLRKCKLVSENGKDYIKINTKGILVKDACLYFTCFSSLRNIEFFTKTSSKFKVKGNYSTSSAKINWTWKPFGGWSTSWILIDKSRKNKVMAKIEGLSLISSKSGTLTITSEVHTDFHDTIVTTACLVWRKHQNIGESGYRKRIMCYF